MRRKIYGLCISLAILLLATQFTSAQNSYANKRVEIISSYGYNDIFSQLLCGRITSAIKESAHGIAVNVTNTDISHCSSFASASNEVRMALTAPVRPDVIVIVGTEAWMVLKESGFDTGNTPVVICSSSDNVISNYRYFIENRSIPDNLIIKAEESVQGYNATGVFGMDNSEMTIKVIKELLPKTTSVYYFSEHSFEDIINIRKLEVIAASKGIRLIVSNTGKIDIDFLNSSISNFTKQNSAIIINSCRMDVARYDNEIYGERYIPVFQMKELQTDNPLLMLGGVYTSTRTMAKATATAVKKILDGADAGSMPLTYIKVSKPSLSKLAAQKIGLKLSGDKYNLIYEEETSFFERYISKIAVALLVFLIVIVLIVNMMSTERNKKSAKDLELYRKLVKDYSVIFKNSPIGIAAFTTSGKFIEDNPKAAAELSKTVPDYKEKTFSLFNSPYVSESTKEKIRHKEVVDRHFIFKVNNANIFQRVIFIPATTGNSDSIVLLILNNTDVYTKRAEKDKINTSFLLAMDASKYGVAKFDLKKTEYAYIGTDSWFANLKIKNGTTLDSSFNSLAKEDLAAILRFSEEAISKSTKQFSSDVRIKNEDGSDHWLHLSIQVSNYSESTDQVICYGIVTDIEQQKERSLEMSKKYDSLVKATRLKNALITNMSSELKTPLNALIGFAELMVEASPEDDKAQLQKYVEENNNEFLDLVNQVVDVSMIESGSAEKNLSEFNLKEVFSQAISSAAASIQNGKISIISDNVSDAIIGSDRERVYSVIQLLANSAGNSLRTATEKVTINAGYKTDGNNIYIYVSDNGELITPEREAKLFDRFDHLKDESYYGKGIELPIARSIVQFLGGKIGYKADNGKNTVWCTIPRNVASIDNGTAIGGDLQNAIATNEENKKTILIAEDNQNNFQLLNFILRNKYSIIHARDGEEAVKMAESDKPDIILMDIKMPLMDGYEATKTIRATDKKTPIIAVTAYTSEKNKAQAKEYDFSGYISKPVSEGELKRLLSKFLNENK